VLTDTSIVAVGDCTGHGVPGAMMSVLMIRILDEISAANADVTPAQILSQMQNKVVEMLKQRQTDNTDGLDITIAKIQRRKDTADVTIAGAKSYCAFYQMAHNATQLVKGTKKSIGGADEEQKVFEDRTFALASGDRIFLSSDGFIDQNNPDRKCIGSQRFADIIQQSSQLSIDKQQQYIENALAQWQQDQPQRDDICIVGIQI
jgi:serine phosphatase RsbU (regulator of sigma subunit)